MVLGFFLPWVFEFFKSLFASYQISRKLRSICKLLVHVSIDV